MMKIIFEIIVLLLGVGCLGRGGARTGVGSVSEEAPAERIVCLSTSHVGFLRELGLQDRIVSYERNVDVERIVSLGPDLVLVSWAADGERLSEMGLRCEVIGEWLETTPLERAEWIVRVAELCGEREKGERRFEQIARAYEAERARAEKLAAERSGGLEVSGEAPRKPRVMLNAPYGGVWFVPGDDNYMVRLVEDAGGECAMTGRGAESSPIDIEAAYMAMQSADMWLNVNEYTSLAALLADNRRFADTPPVVDGRVFNNIARPASDGTGSDFWESGVVRPDLVLRDLVNILHPEAVAGDDLYYYMRLR